jgi:hypothetical protein
VMQTPSPINSNIRGSLVQSLGGTHGTTGRNGAKLVQPVENRVVVPDVEPVFKVLEFIDLVRCYPFQVLDVVV